MGLRTWEYKAYVLCPNSYVLLSCLLHLLLNLIHNDHMPGIIDDIQDKAVPETQAIEEVRLGEERVLHISHRCILREEELDHVLLRLSDDEEIDLAVRADEAACKLQKLKAREGLERRDDRALPSRSEERR